MAVAEARWVSATVESQYVEVDGRLSTALREYGALQGLPWYDPILLSNILGARSAKMPRLDEEDIRDAQRSFDTNEPQARAILGAMSIEGLALIQGCVKSMRRGNS